MNSWRLLTSLAHTGTHTRTSNAPHARIPIDKYVKSTLITIAWKCRNLFFLLSWLYLHQNAEMARKIPQLFQLSQYASKLKRTQSALLVEIVLSSVRSICYLLVVNRIAICQHGAHSECIFTITDWWLWAACISVYHHEEIWHVICCDIRMYTEILCSHLTFIYKKQWNMFSSR